MRAGSIEGALARGEPLPHLATLFSSAGGSGHASMSGTLSLSTSMGMGMSLGTLG